MYDTEEYNDNDLVELRAPLDMGYMYDDLGWADEVVWEMMPDDMYGRYIALKPWQVDLCQGMGDLLQVLWGMFWCYAAVVERHGKTYLRAETGGAWR